MEDRRERREKKGNERRKEDIEVVNERKDRERKEERLMEGGKKQ